MERGTFNDILDKKMGPEEIDETDAFLNILQERINKDMSTETLLRILPNLTDILSDIGHFEQKINYINDGGGIRTSGMLSQFADEAIHKFGDDSKKILIHRSKQITYQYNFEEREFEKSELLANIAYLANTLAHRIEHCIKRGRFDKLDDELFKTKCRETGLQEYSMRDLQQEFYNLKTDCIKELLECQKDGENVRISSYDDPDTGKNVAYVCLPGYFEPFVFHYPEQEIPNIPKAKFCPFYLKTTFNFRVTPEQKEIFEWLDGNYFGPNKDRIEWYVQNQAEFEHTYRISQKTSNDEPIHQNDTSEKQRRKRSKWKTNEEFMQFAQEKIGIPFSQELQQELLSRTSSVNFDKIYVRLQNEIYENLDNMGIEPQNMEADSLKCMIWLKLSYGLAGIGNGTINGDALTNKIVDSVLTYQDAFKYMQEHPNATIKKVKQQIYDVKDKSEAEKTETPENEISSEDNQSIIDKETKHPHNINISNESYTTIAAVLQSRLEDTDRKLEEAQKLMEEAKRREQEAKAERNLLIKTLQELGILPKDEKRK